MHIDRLLHKTLASVMHAKRLKTLSGFVLAAIKTKKLSVTNLGRAADFNIQERSAIRRSDRLIGNPHLQGERQAISQTLIHQLVGHQLHPKIIVDWSSVPNTKHHILRAALIVDGRALTLYEEVHPEKKLGNAKVQKEFLICLKSLLPKDCQPMVVTDAGFHNDWFSEVVARGWNYIGRIRKGKKYIKNSSEWKKVDHLLKGTMPREPEYIGKVHLALSNPLATNLYRFKEKLKGRKALNKNKNKKRDGSSKDYSRGAREAWLLATSLPYRRNTAKKVVTLYKNRMQIEEAFRDLKSHKYGMSFEDAYSRTPERIEILLLIAMLASFVAYLIGCVAESKAMQYQFQANSIKQRRVLSLYFLGCQVVKKNIRILVSELERAIISIQNHKLSIL